MMQNNKIIEKIREEAKSLGACDLVEELVSMTSLSKLMFTPQGIEFLQKNRQYPTLDECREIGKYTRRYGIYVDCSNMSMSGTYRAAFVGDTNAEVSCEGTTSIFTYIVMKGATLTVNASKYAVVRIYNIDGNVTIANDGTAKILM